MDFSDASRLALRYAAAVAARAHGRLTVVYVNDPMLVAAAAAAVRDYRLVARSARELRAFVVATRLPDSSRRVKTRTALGSPATEILELAASARADLIVMGTHGRTGTRRLMLGSTTLSVLQKSSVPVLAVPWPPVDTAGLKSWPGPRIAAALELDARATNDAKTAARIARWFQSSLTLVHVVADMDAPPWLGGVLSGHDRIRLAQAQRRIDAAAAGAGRFVDTDALIVHGDPADEIAAVVAARRARLLVTALRDRRGWFGARRGSIPYHVLSHAVAPVLAWPPQWQLR